MAKTKVIELRFPNAGVVRRSGYSDRHDPRAPYPTPWAVNVRPEDPFDKRLRGGSMPTTRPTVATYGADALVDQTLLTEDGNTLITESALVIILDQKTTLGTATASVTGCLYRGRLVLIDSTETNAIKMSRQGDYDDWDYGKDVGDIGRALFFQLSEAGEIGGAVTALVPHQDAFLLAATADTLWIVQGDPAANGTLRNVSRNAGIVSAAAWAKADDAVVFLAKDGIYSVQANGSGLQNLSLDRIPQELLDVDSAVLGYSHADNAVYIFAVTDAVNSNWMFDLGGKGFWPVDNDVAPTESHLLIGPIKMGEVGSFGQLVALHGVLGEDSGSVTWRVVTGDTAEDAVEHAKADIIAGTTTYAADSGTWAAGRSHLSYPRIRSQWIVIWLHSTAQWAYEEIILEISQFGRWR
jgi:hypothetical protein